MKGTRRNAKNQPASRLVKETHSQPSVHLNKKVVPRVETESPLSSELTNEFFTKQRPDSWQYYYRSFTLKGFGRTGGGTGVDGLNTDAQGAIAVLDTITEGQALIVNHFRVSFGYKPNADAVPSTGSEIYTFFEDNALMDLEFSFNLQSTQSVLADVNGIYAANYLPGDDIQNPFNTAYAGYRTLNQNVLENAESSTSLYVFEPSNVQFKYVLNLDPATKLAEYMVGPLPGSGKFAQPTLFIEIRGHMLNRLDGQLLQTLVQPKHVLPKGIK